MMSAREPPLQGQRLCDLVQIASPVQREINLIPPAETAHVSQPCAAAATSAADQAQPGPRRHQRSPPGPLPTGTVPCRGAVPSRQAAQGNRSLASAVPFPFGLDPRSCAMHLALSTTPDPAGGQAPRGHRIHRPSGRRGERATDFGHQHVPCCRRSQKVLGEDGRIRERARSCEAAPDSLESHRPPRHRMGGRPPGPSLLPTAVLQQTRGPASHSHESCDRDCGQGVSQARRTPQTPRPRDHGGGARFAMPSPSCFILPKLPPRLPASSSRAFVLIEEFPQPQMLSSEIF